MKILIICNTKTSFARELQNELVKIGKDVSLLDFEFLELFDKDGKNNDTIANKFAKLKKIPKIHMFFRLFFISQIAKNYDVINIHVARWYYSLIVKALKHKKVVVSFYGSDFYRSSKHARRLLYPLLKVAKTVTFTNEKTQNSFLDHYRDFEEKAKVCRFGLKTLEFIDINRDKNKPEIKKHLGYSEDKTIVTCGYNSTKAQQHEKIIENIIKLPQDILENIQFIFPMTYGDNANREKIKSVLSKTNLNYIVLEDFLTGDDNAYIKLASDIMINILTTDSFSGSMQEFLYAKNVVVTGSWLPYDIFDREGIVYEKISSSDMLTSKLETILLNTNKYKSDLDKNRDIVSKLSSWKYNIQDWIEVLK